MSSVPLRLLPLFEWLHRFACITYPDNPQQILFDLSVYVRCQPGICPCSWECTHQLACESRSHPLVLGRVGNHRSELIPNIIRDVDPV